MCHNMLLPSKGSNEWRNIPFQRDGKQKTSPRRQFLEQLVERIIFSDPFSKFCLSLMPNLLPKMADAKSTLIFLGPTFISNKMSFVGPMMTMVV